MDKQIDSQMAPLKQLKDEIMVHQRLSLVSLGAQVYAGDGRRNECKEHLACGMSVCQIFVSERLTEEGYRD